MSATVDPLAEQLGNRPAWQVLTIGVGIVVLTLLGIVAAVGTAALTETYSPIAGRLHQAAVGLVVVLLIYETARRISGVPVGALLASRPSRTLFGWISIALAFPTGVLGVQLWLLDARLLGAIPTWEALLRAVGASLAAGLFAGVLEELSFRGALLRVLEARWGARRAIAGTALAFAALHQGHATRPVELLLVVSTMFAAGILLAVVVVRTRSVWNAVAMHAGWNTVFGGSIVAAAPSAGLLDPAVLQFKLPAASVWLTGSGATLGATPLTTVCLLCLTGLVIRGPDAWVPSHPSCAPGDPWEQQ